MKLSECTIGKLVQERRDGMIGHIVGLTFNCDVEFIAGMSTQELRSRTIPLVKYPHREFPIGIHYANIEECTDGEMG